MRYGYAINFGSESKIGGVQRRGGPILGATANESDGVRFASAGLLCVLQEYRPGGRPEGSLGQGVIVCIVCDDAIAVYHELISRRIAADLPFVRNRLCTVTVQDPDGYRLVFESATDLPESKPASIHWLGCRRTSKRRHMSLKRSRRR
jgi:hypothetical protein